MGDVLHQPSRPVLPAHVDRAQTARSRTLAVGANGLCDHPRNAAGLTYRSLHPSRDKYSRTGFLLPCRAAFTNLKTSDVFMIRRQFAFGYRAERLPISLLNRL